MAARVAVELAARAEAPRLAPLRVRAATLSEDIQHLVEGMEASPHISVARKASIAVWKALAKEKGVSPNAVGYLLLRVLCFSGASHSEQVELLSFHDKIKKVLAEHMDVPVEPFLEEMAKGREKQEVLGRQKAALQELYKEVVASAEVGFAETFEEMRAFYEDLDRRITHIRTTRGAIKVDVVEKMEKVIASYRAVMEKLGVTAASGKELVSVGRAHTDELRRIVKEGQDFFAP